MSETQMLGGRSRLFTAGLARSRRDLQPINNDDD
jgi:hypothetical protein